MLDARNAITVAMSYDANGANVVINIGAGTFSGSTVISSATRGLSKAINGGGNTYNYAMLELVGAGHFNTFLTDGASGNCGTILTSGGGTIVGLSGMTISNSSTNCGHANADLFAINNSTVLILSDVAWGGASQQIHAEGNTVVELAQNDYITANAYMHYAIYTGGRVIIDATTTTFVGVTGFYTDFMQIDENGSILANSGAAFSGCTGISANKYDIESNGVFDANGVTSYKATIPGSGLTTTASGGQYVP